jgi:cell division protein FtsZ
MAGMGYAVMGTATAKGDRRAVEAAQKAIASPLLETGAIDGARGLLINITGSSSLKLAEVNEASTIIQSAAHEDANIIFGAVHDEKMKDDIKITVIATGFRTDQPVRKERTVSAAAAAIQNQRSTHFEPKPSPAVSARHDPPPMAESAPAPAVQTTPKPEPIRHVPDHSNLEPFEEGARLVASEPEPAPAPVAPPQAYAPPQRDNASLESVKNTVKAEFQEDDLDVPAFIRKRNEVK